MLIDYFRLAYRSARHRKLRAWLTMIGIFIGIAAVVSLLSLSQGLKDAIGQQFLSLGTDKLIVQAAGGGFGPPGTAVPNPLTKEDKKKVEKVRGVDIAVGRLIRIAKLEFKDEIKYGYLVSMPEDRAEQQLVIEANNYKLEEGKFFEKGDIYKVIMSKHINDDFFEKEIGLRDKIKIQGHVFQVVGLLKPSGNPQQDHTFVVPEEALRLVLDIPQDYDVVPLRVKSGEDVNQVANAISKELRRSRNVKEGKEDFTVETPQQVIAILNNILLIIQGVLVGIAAISLLIGGIGIMNTMYTAVVERTKEIGIMKAIGATNREISSLFLIESGFLGFFGGVIGVCLGYGISKLAEVIAFQIFESPLIKASVSLELVLGMLLFAFVVGGISGLYPAKQAARLRPVDALRK